MYSSQLYIFCLLSAAGIVVAAQIAPDFAARNTVPDTLASCYHNTTAYNRFTRQPMHIENLIAIIRKIEQKTFNQWDVRRIVRTIINRYEFNGLRFIPHARPEFQFEPKSEETIKTNLIKSMLPGGEDIIPEGTLDNDEKCKKCALHWMLSHSMNATLRDDETENIRYNGLRAKRWTWDESEEEGHSDESSNMSADVEIAQSPPQAPIKDESEPAKVEAEVAGAGSDPEVNEKASAAVANEEPKEGIQITDDMETENDDMPAVADTNKADDASSLQSSESKAKSNEDNSMPDGDAKAAPAVSNENPPKTDSSESSESAPKAASADSNESPQKEASSETNEIPHKTAPIAEKSESMEFSAEEAQPQPLKSVDVAEKSKEKSSSEEKTPVEESKQDAPANSEESKEKSSSEEKTPVEESKQDAPANSEESKEKSPSSEEKPPVAIGGRMLNLPSDREEDDVVFVEGLQTANSEKFAKQQATFPTTKMPLETGVVYTKWGSLSVARVLGGIAAALEPSQMSVDGGYIQPYNLPAFSGGNGNGAYYPEGQPNPGNQYGRPNRQSGRRKRQTGGNLGLQPLENLYAATLAGDIGQAAVLNAKFPIQSMAPPRGAFNNTICPREYVLNPLSNPDYDVFRPDQTWTYMTEAEIRGGVDGMILGSKVREWGAGNNLRLSELLEMYYSEAGIKGDPIYRSCNRVSLFQNTLTDRSKLRDQSKSFAWVYNNRTNKLVSQSELNPNSFMALVDETYSKAESTVSNLQMDYPCIRRQVSTGSVDTDDTQKFIPVKTTIFAVIDQTATREEILQQQEFLGKLAADIGVSPLGARLGVVDGTTGQILINPNFTDNAAVLSCAIMTQNLQVRTTDDKPRVLMQLQQELLRVKDIEERTDFESGEGNGVTILFLLQGRAMDEGQRDEIRRLTNDISNTFGYVHVMYASNKVQEAAITGYALNPTKDFIRIGNGNNLVDSVDVFITAYAKLNHGRLYYSRCNANIYPQGDEHKVAVDFYLDPDTIQYYMISPDYFYSAKNLRLRFTSDNGKARICWSTREPFPNSRNVESGVTCRETSGNYAAPGSTTTDVDFGYSKPCGKHGKRAGCNPIYVSVTPVGGVVGGSSTSGMQCTIDGCKTMNQVRVTFSHWEMRCNGGIRAVISSPVALLTAFLSLFMWFKST